MSEEDYNSEDEDAEGGGKRGDEDTAVTPLLSGEHEHTVLTVSKGAGDGGDDEPPKIELRDVRFRYPSRPEQPVLRGLSFSVSSGENVALVGVSGSGKSTIANIMRQFYPANKIGLLSSNIEKSLASLPSSISSSSCAQR